MDEIKSAQIDRKKPDYYLKALKKASAGCYCPWEPCGEYLSCFNGGRCVRTMGLEHERPVDNGRRMIL